MRALTTTGRALPIRFSKATSNGGTMSDQKNLGDEPSGAQPVVKAPRTISSCDLFGRDLSDGVLSGNDKVVIIRHRHDEYRLRITATGKLILTK